MEGWQDSIDVESSARERQRGGLAIIHSEWSALVRPVCLLRPRYRKLTLAGLDKEEIKAKGRENGRGRRGEAHLTSR